MMRFFLVNTFLMILCLRLSAQNLKEDMRFISEAFKTSDYVSFDVDVTIFSKEGDVKPINTMTYQFVKNKDNIRIDQFNNINFACDEYQVFVNTRTKTMFITKIVEETKKERLEREKLEKEEGISFVTEEDLMSVFEQSFDSLDIEYKGEKNGNKSYVIKSNQQVQIKSEIVLDFNNKFIKSISYYYSEDYEYSKVTVTYNKLSYSTNTLSEATFFSVNSKGEKIGVGQFKDYELIY